MNDNKGRYLTDHDAQLFFDAANKLLNAARSDGEKSRRAASELVFYVNNTEGRLKKLECEVINTIHESAELTANKTADLLSAKFQEADAAANKAAKLYQKSAQSLNRRTWIYFFGVQFVLVFIAVVLILTLIPSLDEINQRRAELDFYKSQPNISKLKWSKCGDEDCIRMDEVENEEYKGRDGSTWRIPWRG